MSTASVGNILAERVAQFKQTQTDRTETLRVYEPGPQPILIKPAASSWEVLTQKLEQVINLPGLLTTVKELYDQGYGAELETAAEIALATATKSPFHLFAAMVSKKSGNWHTKTLQVVYATWEVRRNAREVIEKLKLKAESTKAVLALAWRLKGSIMRFLGIALEQGTGIKNPAGVFFALTKQQPATA
jgi:hypothetical protein